MRWCVLRRIATLAMLSDAAYSQSYDVIIIGSGPGGLVAAELLTRFSDLSVLMLEAGPLSLQASGGTDTPAYAQAQGPTKFDIPGEFNLVAYSKENENYRIDWIDSPYMWLGKLLGGCSSINAALYFRTPDSYVEKSSWPFPASQVTQGFEQVETFLHVTETPSPDGVAYLQEAYEIVSRALRANGYTPKSSLNDATARNAKHKTFGHPPYAIHDGLRDAPAKTLVPLLQKRGNFELLTQAKVQYIQQRQGNATGVMYTQGTSKSPTLTQATLTDRGVVVMAAGALNTPAILMQSGIGPSQQLTKLAALQAKFPGVSAVQRDWVVNEQVGQHVFDTSVVYASFRHPQMKPFLYKSKPVDALSQYMSKNRTGPWATPGPVLIAYETMELHGREFELQTTVLPHGFGEFYETSDAFSTGLFLNNPLSRDFISFSDTGELNVATNKSWYGAHADDVEVLSAYVESVVTAFTKTGAMFLNGERNRSDTTPSTETTKAWVKSQLGSVTHHFGGSCFATKTVSASESDSTGAPGATSCADGDFKVVGTRNVFVSDASLMKEGTVNPYAFVLYIGHQAGKNVLHSAFQRAATTNGSSESESSVSPVSSSGSSSSTDAWIVAVAALVLLCGLMIDVTST